MSTHDDDHLSGKMSVDDHLVYNEGSLKKRKCIHGALVRSGSNGAFHISFYDARSSMHDEITKSDRSPFSGDWQISGDWSPPMEIGGSADRSVRSNQ